MSEYFSRSGQVSTFTQFSMGAQAGRCLFGFKGKGEYLYSTQVLPFPGVLSVHSHAIIIIIILISEQACQARLEGWSGTALRPEN